MKIILSTIALGLVFLFTTGCVQMPTEKQSVVDLRPQISFVAVQGHHDARVFVDNAEVGRVGDFIDGVAALRIIPGSHVVRVVSGGAVLLEERFYVADGVSRSFILR
jgi:hypothetical protein